MWQLKTRQTGAGMGVATGGASRGRAPPLCLSGRGGEGAGPPNLLGADHRSLYCVLIYVDKIPLQRQYIAETLIYQLSSLKSKIGRCDELK